jgi:PPM family protein phosphatase
MYFISSIISRISYGFYRFGNVIFGPFRSLGYGLRSLTRFNPLRTLRNSFYGVESQIRSILRLPNQASSSRRPSLSADVPREQRTNRWRARSRARVSQRAQYSQIHLIKQSNNERTVVHIGTIIGRSSSQIILNQPDHRPVQLRFSQVDPQQYKAPMLLAYVAGEATLQVNGTEVEHEAPLTDNAVIQVDDEQYVCQLYAWDKAPIVTRVDAGWATDVGPTREENEDAIGIYQYPDSYLFAIADGVGKGEYGAQVSEFAIRYLLAVFHENAKYHLNWHDILAKAYKYINAEVRHFARHSPSSEGTTLTAAVIKGMEAHVAHVGDSRLYHWHEGGLRQVTTDHIGQMVVEQDTRVANEATEPPQTRSVLSKAIGKSDSIQPDIFTIPLQPGDRLLFCSDGVIGAIPVEELEQIFPTMRAGRLAGHLIQC